MLSSTTHLLHETRTGQTNKLYGDTSFQQCCEISSSLLYAVKSQ